MSALLLGFIRPAHAASNLCYSRLPNDPTAIQWLLEQSRSIRFPYDDFYSSDEWRDLQELPLQVNASNFGEDDQGQCAICVAGAAWSPDKRFIAFEVGNALNTVPSEVFVARIQDRVAWRVSKPEQLFDVNTIARGFKARVTSPTWHNATNIDYIRCVVSGRFDLIESIPQPRSASLPRWLLAGEQPPKSALADDIAKALPRFWEAQNNVFRSGSAERDRSGIAVNSVSGVIYVLIGKVFGHIKPSGDVERLWLERPHPSGLPMLADESPYAMAVDSKGVLFEASSPYNVFEFASIFQVASDQPPKAVAAYSWNPVAIVVSGDSKTAYVADPFANIVYRVTLGTKAPPDVFAGSCTNPVSGSLGPLGQVCAGEDVDGAAHSARFNQPNGLALDETDGLLFIADTANNKIRMIRKDGSVTTLAGRCIRLSDNPNCIGMFRDGKNGDARFYYPTALAFDTQDRVLYVADTGNGVVRRVTLEGEVSTFLGTPDAGRDCPKDPNTAYVGYPSALAFDKRTQTLLVLDRDNDSVRRATRDGRMTTLLHQPGSPCL